MNGYDGERKYIEAQGRTFKHATALPMSLAQMVSIDPNVTPDYFPWSECETRQETNPQICYCGRVWIVWR